MLEFDFCIFWLIICYERMLIRMLWKIQFCAHSILAKSTFSYKNVLRFLCPYQCFIRLVYLCFARNWFFFIKLGPNSGWKWCKLLSVEICRWKSNRISTILLATTISFIKLLVSWVHLHYWTNRLSFWITSLIENQTTGLIWHSWRKCLCCIWTIIQKY